MAQRVYGQSEYILKDIKPGSTRGKYVALGGRYTSDPGRARVFRGNYLKDIRTVNHRQWREDFRAIEQFE